MPELPEVEMMTRHLRRWTEDQHITLRLLDSTILKSQSSGDITGVAEKAYRRGKYTLLPIGDSVVVFHYRMTGKLVCGLERAHSRVQLIRAHSESIWFVDTRRLGELWLIPKAQLDAFWCTKKLGPEIYPKTPDGTWWKDRFVGLKAPIKNALLRQDRVAGIGNICASEICFRARIHPKTSVVELSDSAWSELAKATQSYLDAIIEEEEGAELQYVSEGGRLPNAFWVYGREGQSCRRCEQPICRIVQAGRATYYCEFCTPTQ